MENLSLYGELDISGVDAVDSQSEGIPRDGRGKPVLDPADVDFIDLTGEVQAGS